MRRKERQKNIKKIMAKVSVRSQKSKGEEYKFQTKL
jgi:hypothetical protein